ncbi:AUGMIN subunit 8-like [Curcuma longa]|uniref:AUGMIN subunit 8-like n=1 Tax=Curcuma longa TaxID=136217 RepID=UPI003D9F905C
MDARNIEPLGATAQSKPTQEEDNSGPPLLPSEKSNATLATRKPRTVASRYMNGISSTPVSSSSNSKRCSSPISSRSHTSTVPGMSMPKRSQSAERRPVKPSSRFSAPSSPSRPSTPPSPSSRPATPVRDVTVTHNTARHLLSNKARDGLWPSMRSLSSSFQSESLVVKEKMREKLVANSSSVKSIKSLADAVSERKRTPLRGRNASDQSENSKPPGNSNAKILDQHRWPAMMGGRLPPSVMSRSLDLSDKISKSTRTVASRGVSPNRINLSTDSASRNSKFSLSNASEQSSNHGGRKVERDVKPVVSSSQTPMRSSSAKRPSSNQSSGSPGLRPSSSSGRLPVIPGLHRPSSPSKVLSASSSTSKGMMSPSRTRPSSPMSLSTNVTSRAGGTSSVFKCSGDVQRGKLTASEIEDAHQLKLLYNASMQWHFVNAQTNKTLSIQRMSTENLLQNVWNNMSMSCNSVTMKRIDVHQLQGDLRLGISLKEQMTYLEQWAALEKDHFSSLSGAIKALNSSTLRLPITGGAKADITDMKNAVSSAVDILQAMGSCVCRLLSRVEVTKSLISEIKAAAENQKSMLDECMKLLAFAAAEQVQESSLRAHLMQLREDARKLN